MPVIQPDTSAAASFEAIEPGTYHAKIVAVEIGVSKAGANKIVPKFEVTVDGKPRTRSAHLLISGPGSFGFDQLLRATGFADMADKYRDPAVDNPPFDTDQLVGQELSLVIDADMYNNNASDKIKTYLKA
jgi:hypothetical protein